MGKPDTDMTIPWGADGDWDFPCQRCRSTLASASGTLSSRRASLV
jgi:hypothetical protein